MMLICLELLGQVRYEEQEKRRHDCGILDVNVRYQSALGALCYMIHIERRWEGAISILAGRYAAKVMIWLLRERPGHSF